MELNRDFIRVALVVYMAIPVLTMAALFVKFVVLG